MIREEPLADLDSGRLGDAVAVRQSGSAIEGGVGTVERDAVLPEATVLLLDELEVDLGQLR